jgi:hypothetical protein
MNSTIEKKIKQIQTIINSSNDKILTIEKIMFKVYTNKDTSEKYIDREVFYSLIPELNNYTTVQINNYFLKNSINIDIFVKKVYLNSPAQLRNTQNNEKNKIKKEKKEPKEILPEKIPENLENKVKELEEKIEMMMKMTLEKNEPSEKPLIEKENTVKETNKTILKKIKEIKQEEIEDINDIYNENEISEKNNYNDTNNENNVQNDDDLFLNNDNTENFVINQNEKQNLLEELNMILNPFVDKKKSIITGILFGLILGSCVVYFINTH